MINEMTKKPMKILGDTGLKLLTVPRSQLPEVRTLFDANNVFYWVSDTSISIDDGPLTIGNRDQQARGRGQGASASRQRGGMPMSLADDIRALHARFAAELDAAADEFTHLRDSLKLVEESVQHGRAFYLRSEITGSRVTQDELVSRLPAYTSNFRERIFQEFLSIFENWLFGLLRLWLTTHSQGLGAKKLDYKDRAGTGRYRGGHRPRSWAGNCTNWPTRSRRRGSPTWRSG